MDRRNRLAGYYAGSAITPRVPLFPPLTLAQRDARAARERASGQVEPTAATQKHNLPPKRPSKAFPLTVWCLEMVGLGIGMSFLPEWLSSLCLIPVTVLAYLSFCAVTECDKDPLPPYTDKWTTQQVFDSEG